MVCSNSPQELVDLSVADAQAALALSVSEKWPHDLRDWQTMVSLGTGVRMWVSSNKLGAVGLRFDHGEAASTVGMIIVGDELRGRGLGKQVMRSLISDTNPSKAPAIAPGRSTWLYATQAVMPLYSGLGFQEAGVTCSFRGTLKTSHATPSHAIRMAGASELSAIATLDLATFGAPRIALLDRLLKNEGALAIAESNGEVTVSVADRGVGIPPEELEGVFERFRRGGSASAMNEEGLGLGLPLAKAIVEAHKGRIRMESREGEGTTVTVALPTDKGGEA